MLLALIFSSTGRALAASSTVNVSYTPETATYTPTMSFLSPNFLAYAEADLTAGDSVTINIDGICYNSNESGANPRLYIDPGHDVGQSADKYVTSSYTTIASGVQYAINILATKDTTQSWRSRGWDYTSFYRFGVSVTATVVDVKTAVGTKMFNVKLLGHDIGYSGSVDGFNTSLNITLNITGGNPTYTAPTYTIPYGTDLSALILPDSFWSWESTMSGVLPVGTYTKYASYSPPNYSSVSNIPITIAITPYKVKFEVEVP